VRRLFNADLEIAYRFYNKRYFGNRLPKDMVVRFEDIIELGKTYCFFERPLYILINRKIAWHGMLVEMTLLHEMVHVENTKAGHGPWFHKRMLRLAKAGAFRNSW